MLEALWCVMALLKGELAVDQLLPATRATRWLEDDEASFSLAVNSRGHSFEYSLSIRYANLDGPTEVLREALHANGEVLAAYDVRESGDVRGPLFPKEFKRPHGQSWIGWLCRAPLLGDEGTAFLDEIELFQVLQPNPYRILGRTEERVVSLETDGENFGSWLNHQFRDTQYVQSLLERLSDYLDGFESMVFAKMDADMSSLKVRLQTPAGPQEFAMSELSEGQRVILLLVSVLLYSSKAGSCLVLDEPDNFLSPLTARTFVNELYTRSDLEQELQVIVVSHNPNVIEEISSEYVKIFSRPLGTETRIDSYPNKSTSEILELLSRGWLIA